MREASWRSESRFAGISRCFLPAVLVYTAMMIVPLFGTLNLSLFNLDQGNRVFVGMRNFATLFGDPRWSDAFWNALGNNTWFFVVHMLVQDPIGVMLAALLSSPRLRGRRFTGPAIFIPTILSFVIVGFVWKLILSPIWGSRRGCWMRSGLKKLFAPWLGKEEYALTTLALISVWQFVGIPMMLIYAGDAVHSRRGDRGPPRWTASPAGRSSGRSSCPDPARDRHHLDPDVCGEFQRL